MKRMVNFEWYVMNESSLRNGEIVPFNVFNNISVYNAVIARCDKMWLEMDMNSDANYWAQFVEDLRRIFQWQEWSRCEYEILVSPVFKDAKPKKIDCYQQLEPNMEIIAKYVWATYLDQVPSEYLDELGED